MGLIVKIALGVAVGLWLYHDPSGAITSIGTAWAVFLVGAVLFFLAKVIFEDLDAWWKRRTGQTEKSRRKSLGYD